MDINGFFELFYEEISTSENLSRYYNLNKNSKMYFFRKAYFLQRLEYIYNQTMNFIKNKNLSYIKIWDCGCGYGTTALFFAMNNIRVHGTTIGLHYANGIEKRKEYWSKFGEANLFTVDFNNLFETPPPASTYNIIILQDVLHHLEPLDVALDILSTSLKDEGQLIAAEANGNSFYHKIVEYKRRQNNRIIEVYDELLKKNVLQGNENYKNRQTWINVLKKHNLAMENFEYIKLFPPFCYNKNNMNKIVDFEQEIWRKAPLLGEYFFFGMNFTAPLVKVQNTASCSEILKS